MFKDFIKELEQAKTETAQKVILKKYSHLILNPDQVEIRAHTIRDLIEQNQGDDYFETLPEDEQEYLDMFTPEERASMERKLDEYFERKEKEQETETKIAKLKTQELTPEEIEAAKKKAEIISKTTIKDKWMSLFKKVCYYNDAGGEILFHSLLGQMIQAKAYKNITELPLQIHFFWLQEARSGKGVGIKHFMMPLLSYIKTAHGAQVMRMGEFSGNDTDAATLDTPEVIKGKPTGKTIPGTFTRYQFYYFEEASCLLKQPTKYSQNLVTNLQKILERKPIIKNTLCSGEMKTIGEGTFIGTTYPTQDLDKFIVNNGLMQRTIVYIQHITKSLRDEMDDKSDLSCAPNPEGADIYDTEIKNLAIELQNIVSKYDGKTLEFSEPDIIITLIHQLRRELSSSIDEKIKNENYKSILRQFASASLNNLLILSYHNMIARNGATVEKSDVMQAHKLLKLCMNNLAMWLYENLDLGHKQQKVTMIFSAINKILVEHADDNGEMKRKDCLEILDKTGKLGIRVPGIAYYLRNRMTGDEPFEIIKSGRILRLKREEK